MLAVIGLTTTVRVVLPSLKTLFPPRSLARYLACRGALGCGVGPEEPRPLRQGSCFYRRLHQRGELPSSLGHRLPYGLARALASRC